MAISEQANLLIRISADAAGAKAGLGTLKSQIDGLGSTVLKVAGLIAGAFALRDVIKTTQDWGLQLDNLHDTLGLSGQAAANWNYQARIVGTTADDIGTAFGQLTNKIGNALPAIQAGTSDFDKWGISVLDANNTMMSADDILGQVRDRVNELGPGLAARQLEMDLFGRSGGKLHDFLALSNAELRQMKSDLNDLGLPTNVDELEAMNREGNRLGFVFDSLKIRLGSALLPILLTVGRALASLSGVVKSFGEALRSPLGIIKEVVDRFGKFITQVKEQGFVKAAGDLARDVVSKVGEGLGNTGTWVGNNLPIWRSNMGSLFDNTVTWVKDVGWPRLVQSVTIGVPAFANWIVTSLPTWTANLSNLISEFLDWWFNKGLPTIVAGFGTAVSTIGRWILDAIGWMSNVGLPAAATTLLAIGGAILGGILRGLGAIAGHTGIGKWFVESIGWISNVGLPGTNVTLGLIGGAIRDGILAGAGNIGKLLLDIILAPLGLSKISEAIKKQLFGGGMPGAPSDPRDNPDTSWIGVRAHLASGGIVTQPTRALIGEAGPEAVIPLDRMGGMGSVNISIVVNGDVDSSRRVREIARAVGEEIMSGIGSRRSFAF